MATTQVAISSSFSHRRQPLRKSLSRLLLLRCLIWAFLRVVTVQGQHYMSNDVVSCDETYSIEKQMNGTIQTPGFPHPYPQRKFCNISLKGDSKHRVILSFEAFYLFHPNGPNHKKHAGCNGLDILRIFDGPDEKSKLLGEFCGGHRPPLPMMSSGPHLFLRLTSYTSGRGAKGFSANFSFVSNFGIDSGAQKAEGICEFFYDTMEEKEGRITSPNPGGIYPNNANCTYIFDGTFLERVYLKFHYFDLEGIEPCTVRSGSDFLEFSNMPGKDPCPSRRCGRFIPQEVVSNGPYFRITFRSNERLSGLGFAASYRFVTDEHLPDWASYLRTNTAPYRHQMSSIQATILKVLLLRTSTLLFY